MRVWAPLGSAAPTDKFTLSARPLPATRPPRSAPLRPPSRDHRSSFPLPAFSSFLAGPFLPARFVPFFRDERFCAAVSVGRVLLFPSPQRARSRDRLALARSRAPAASSSRISQGNISELSFHIPPSRQPKASAYLLTLCGAVAGCRHIGNLAATRGGKSARRAALFEYSASSARRN